MGIAGAVAVAVVLCTLFIPQPSLVGGDTALDFCVGDLQAPSYPSGYACKKRDLVTADDFAYSGLRNPGKADNLSKTAVAPAFATELPALNGLGLSLARVDIEPGGAVLTHTHPRSSELALIVQGRVLVGFISTDNVPYSNTLEEGDIMAIPRGVLHYLINVGETAAIAYATFSSPTPGLQWTSYALFGNDLPADVVSKSTFISELEVKRLKDLLANESRNKRLFPEINEKDEGVIA